MPLGKTCEVPRQRLAPQDVLCGVPQGVQFIREWGGPLQRGPRASPISPRLLAFAGDPSGRISVTRVRGYSSAPEAGSIPFWMLVVMEKRWWRRRGLNPRPPRCERGALPAELLPHLRAGKHSRRFPPELSMPGGASGLSILRVDGNPAETIKFFPVLPIRVLSVRVPEGTCSLPGGSGNKSPWRKKDWRTTRESTPGKGSRRAHLPCFAISIPRKGRFSGIANRPHVIRGKRMNIKKVHGNRHFPVDTLNPIF